LKNNFFNIYINYKFKYIYINYIFWKFQFIDIIKYIHNYIIKTYLGTVTCIKIKKNDKECVSSSADGSTIFWDLERHVRSQVVFAPSFLKAVVYYPDESQILTSGTDRKVIFN